MGRVWRAAASFAVVMAFVAAFAATSSAATKRADPPTDDPIRAFAAADASRWLVSAGSDLHITHDGGKTWKVIPEAPSVDLLAFDGRHFLAFGTAKISGRLKIFRFDMSGSYSMDEVYVRGTSSANKVTDAFIARDGNIYTVFQHQNSMRQWILSRIGKGDTAVVLADESLSFTPRAFHWAEIGGRLLFTPYTLWGRQEKILDVSGGEAAVVTSQDAILFKDEDFALGLHGISHDGGLTFRPWGEPAQPIPRNPDAPDRDLIDRNGELFVARGDTVLPAVPVSVDGDYRDVNWIQTRDGIAGWSESAIYWTGDSEARWNEAHRELPPDTQAIVSRFNRLLADAGLPPVYGDPWISQAARNHAGWMALNDNYGHDEIPGTPGFTGESLSDRCRAVGARCWGEIAFRGMSDAIEAVDRWTTTPYHRMDPRVGLIGGARSQDFFVVNYGVPRNVLTKPVGFPRGIWRGPLGWSGNEIPSPLLACRTARQPIKPPIGPAISLNHPDRAAQGRAIKTEILSVRPVGGDPLKGCFRPPRFLPEDPLVAGATYEVVGRWQAFRDAPIQHVKWRFKAQPDPQWRDTGLTDRSSLTRKPIVSNVRFRPRVISKSNRKRRVGTLSYRLSRRARTAITVFRVGAGRRVRGRCMRVTPANRARSKCRRMVKGLSVQRVQNGGLRRINLRARRFRPGVYQVRIAARNGHGASQPRRTHFRVR